MNYLIYPTKTLLISQNYTDTYSHYKNYLGTPRDFPIDETSGEAGRSYFYTPCDEVVVKRIWGVGTGGTNTIWLQSTSKVTTPTFTDYVTIMIIHPNDDTLKNIKVGDTFKRGEPIFLEGNDGNATGYHFHISVSRGKYVAPGWQNNSLNGYVITGDSKKPEEVFFIDKDFTKVINNKNLKFKYLIKDYGDIVKRDSKVNQLQVVDNIKLLDTNKKELGNLNKGIYNYLEVENNYYKIEYSKGLYGYINVENTNTIIYEKEEIEVVEKISIIKKIGNIIKNIFNNIKNLFK